VAVVVVVIAASVSIIVHFLVVAPLMPLVIAERDVVDVDADAADVNSNIVGT